MDAELEVIVARLPTFEPGGSTDARTYARTYQENLGISTPGRDELAISDRLIPGPPDGPDVEVRVYDPRRGGARVGLVYFHGGGFIAGDLDTEDSRCVQLARDAGCVVVSVDYRLAPEHRFPAPVDDGYAALVWTTSMAAELDLDPARIGVGGGSAGGALAAAIALMARDRGGPPVAFQMLLNPVLDDRIQTASMGFVGTPLIDGDSVARLWDVYLGPDRGDISPYAAPARAVDLSGLPPTYVMTAELDPLRDEGIEYATRLLRAGVSVELHQFGGAFHAFDLLPSAISRRAAAEQAVWLRTIAQSEFRGEQS
jgi:acetyl esterase/lipase